MNLLIQLKNLIFRKNNSDSVENGQTLSQSEIIIDNEKPFEEIYQGKTDSEIISELFEKDEDALTSEELSFKLGITLHNEHTHGRLLAIKDLVNETYHILRDEYGNPFKELINFTLLYFANERFRNQQEIENIIRHYFPIMEIHLINKINLINPDLHLDINFKNNKDEILDEQKGYDEFLDFIYLQFTKSFPDKTSRDKAIMKNFKIFGRDLIAFIESELNSTNNKKND